MVCGCESLPYPDAMMGCFSRHVCDFWRHRGLRRSCDKGEEGRRGATLRADERTGRGAKANLARQTPWGRAVLLRNPSPLATSAHGRSTWGIAASLDFLFACSACRLSGSFSALGLLCISNRAVVSLSALSSLPSLGVFPLSADCGTQHRFCARSVPFLPLFPLQRWSMP